MLRSTGEIVTCLSGCCWPPHSIHGVAKWVSATGDAAARPHGSASAPCLARAFSERTEFPAEGAPGRTGAWLWSSWWPLVLCRGATGQCRRGFASGPGLGAGVLQAAPGALFTSGMEGSQRCFPPAHPRAEAPASFGTRALLCVYLLSATRGPPSTRRPSR